MTGPWIAAFAVLAGCVILLGLIVLGLMRRILPALEAAESRVPVPFELLDGLAPGAVFPPIDMTDEAGRAVAVTELAGAPFVLALLTRDCEPCRRLADWMREVDPSHLGVPVVVLATDEPGRDGLSLPDWIRVLYSADHSLPSALHVNTYPFAFAIDANLSVVRASGASADIVGELAETLRKGGDRALDQESSGGGTETVATAIARKEA